jgi:methylmalonyl-CoA/ethylmalonyl-CoA epimerase
MTGDPGAQERLHHVGFVVASIEGAVRGFEQAVGLRWQTRIFDDPLQRVRVTFLGENGAPQIELVQPDGADSPVRAFLSRGGGLHHLCYETEDLEARLAVHRSAGSIVVRTPVPAVAFDGRRIAWIYTRQRLLIEYLEQQRHS